MKTIAILGRQPAIGLAELESLYGDDVLQSISEVAVAIDLDHDKIDFQRLGGSIKLASVEKLTQPNEIKQNLQDILINLGFNNRLNFGVSYYGQLLKLKDINKIALDIKKSLAVKGQKVRYVPNKSITLNSAQIWHNQLLGEKGIEFILVEYDGAIIVAKTQEAQDIFAYGKRDQNRPFRDARVGMLPPKLAQIIINLASGSDNIDGKLLFDPFCGTGVILQEALLDGFIVRGSDIDPRMVDYSLKNLSWLAKKFAEKFDFDVSLIDASQAKWPFKIDLVASETYLGTAYSNIPNPKKLINNIEITDKLIKEFLINIHGQLKPGVRLCLALPAWHVDGEFKHLPTLDQINNLGYNRVAFKLVEDRDLIYHRSGQIVGRELVTLLRK